MGPALRLLLERLDEPTLATANVISWGAPVPVFGDPSRSSVATLGLNPSNREFVDALGRELVGDLRRFHTLNSLGLTQWSDIDSAQLRLIAESCRKYFQRNPYDGWFKVLDQIISGTKKSYYSNVDHACHLDLIPYATTCKWTDLTSHQRSLLLSVSGNALGVLIRESPIRLLILNGQAVVTHFEKIAEVCFEKNIVPEWTLPRKANQGVSGIAYKGLVKRIAGVRLNQDLIVLGYNHNIQSSFGVTAEVKSAIRSWIARSSEEVFS